MQELRSRGFTDDTFLHAVKGMLDVMPKIFTEVQFAEVAMDKDGGNATQERVAAAPQVKTLMTSFPTTVTTMRGRCHKELQ